MAHGITETDHMFSVREKPWHKLGTILPDLATAAEAIEAAKLGWQVDKVPAMYQSPVDSMFKAMPEGYITVRQDTGAAFGQVGRHYTPLQNTEAFNFMDAITQDPGGPKYVTAGSLHGGKKVWLLCKLPEFIEVGRNDAIEQFLLLSNTHDGSRSVEVMWTPVRVVCQNTLTMALRGGAAGRFRVRHMPNVLSRVNEAQDVLVIARENTINLQGMIGGMQSYEPSEQEITRVLTGLFAPKGEKSGSKLNSYTQNILTDVTSLYRDGAANQSAGDTSSAWAFYNGITEYVDHKRSTRAHGTSVDEARFDSSLFGSGAEVKARALNDILELVA